MKQNLSFYEIARWAVVLIALVYLIGMFGGNTASSAKAEDVAAAVWTLCSGALPYVTGQSIDVDGGFHIRRL